MVGPLCRFYILNSIFDKLERGPTCKGAGHQVDFEEQAIGRCWRQGQKSVVHVWRLCMLGTVEEELWRFKDSVANNVFVTIFHLRVVLLI